MNRRITLAALLLLAFCASYAAPLALALESGGMACCRGAKSACCRRAHGAGWVANPECNGQCPCASFATSATSPAIAAASTPMPHPGVAQSKVAAQPAARESRPASVCLYQRPPPAC